MARVVLCWVEEDALAGLDPAEAAAAAGVELDSGGQPSAAVVTAPEERAPKELRARLAGQPVQWLDLAGEVGGGDRDLRLKRAAAAVARAAGRAALGVLPPLYAPQPVQTVLVAGAGLAAAAAAREVALLGHPVLWAAPGRDAAQAGEDDDPEEVSRLAAGLPAGAAAAAETELLHLQGAAGDFRAWLRAPGQKAEAQRFGAVILAPPGRWRTADDDLGLDPDWARPLADLDPAAMAGREDAWFHAAVLAGVNRPLSAPAFARAVEAALALQERPFVQAYLFFCEARVASEGGERLYRRAREAGVLAIRIADQGLEASEGGRLLKWSDPLLGEELELRPDLTATAQEPRADWPEFMTDDVLWPSLDRLLPDHARISGGRTARSGLYVLGALRQTPPGAARREEAAAAAADLHDRLSRPPAPMPVVRHTLCASCLTCVRVCPHGVPRYGAEAVECAPAACLACGICAAECPAEAIAPPGWSNQELFAGLKQGLARAADTPLLLFACSQSAAPAFYQLSREGRRWPAGLLLMPVVCAGRVGQQLILKALTLGARGVLVAGCHDGNCRSITGNLRARLRAKQTRELLDSLDLGPERVKFLHMANNQPQALIRAVEELAAMASEDA